MSQQKQIQVTVWLFLASYSPRNYTNSKQRDSSHVISCGYITIHFVNETSFLAKLSKHAIGYIDMTTIVITIHCSALSICSCCRIMTIMIRIMTIFFQNTTSGCFFPKATNTSGLEVRCKVLNSKWQWQLCRLRVNCHTDQPQVCIRLLAEIMCFTEQTD